ncbi:ABC transporter [Thalassobacillus devorans]|uniref:ABC transporter n=2 Tax=Thalassobacillus devorans TaxID=279813 RepID=A0ABQ1PTQ9_9BACI|nr:lipopolysaccharide core heptose(II) kinase RfaY [Thalassobacillus devorans]NIK29553.1 putative unusual protein kinase regulating ubiquinone biosynthesis (AarF/ABC1/UbiB family) [Thalassobacillus devorans]GGD03771.1 ABC transporter [Thalassobacillus devorans]
MRDRMKYIGIYRVFVIVWMSAKFMLQLFWFHKTNRIWDEETKRNWDNLMAKQAHEYRVKSIRLGGLLIKFGQFLSSRADLLPQVFIKELEGLVDRVKPVPFSYSKKIIEEEWGGELGEFLEYIEEEPVASASIGEVYKASLKDGTPVAIKVQRYRVKEIFQMDFKALRIVFWMLRRFSSYGKKADLQALYREIVTVMSNELDFKKELQNGNHFKKRFKDMENVYIPEYYNDLSTQRVLVMEWIEGARVTDIPFIKENGISREQVARTLFDLCVEQFLYTGMFHSDPHSGNLMLKADGTVVVIDFGMVGEIKKRDASYLRMMIQGFILDDYDQVIDALYKMNFLLGNADTERVKKMLRETVDMYLEGDFTKLDATIMNDIMEDIQQFVKNQPIQLPADYAFLGRATSIIIGVLTAVYPQIDLMAWGKPVIREWMSGADSKYGFYKDIAADTARPLLSLPRALVSFLESGDRDREWSAEKQQNHMFHQFYLFYASLSFFTMIAGGVFGLYWYRSADLLLMWIGFGVGLMGAAGLLSFGRKHVKMMQAINTNRRGP